MSCLTIFFKDLLGVGVSVRNLSSVGKLLEESEVRQRPGQEKGIGSDMAETLYPCFVF